MGGIRAMRHTQTGLPRRGLRIAGCVAAIAIGSGCALMPGELNLSPIYRHRLDADGSVRELDFLWPVFLAAAKSRF